MFTVRCALDSPGHPWTEGNQGLPNGAPTAARSLGAIKGTLWHMVESRLEGVNRRNLKIINLNPN
jgi:hypothetical protein